MYVIFTADCRVDLTGRGTGAGKQGFQKPLVNDSFLVDGMGPLGNVQSERGLTYYEVSLSGHMYVSFRWLSGVNITHVRVSGSHSSPLLYAQRFFYAD
jgi:hypothetical protein